MDRKQYKKDPPIFRSSQMSCNQCHGQFSRVIFRMDVGFHIGIIHLPIYVSIYLFVHPSVHLSIHVSIYLSIYLSILSVLLKSVYKDPQFTETAECGPSQAPLP